MIAKTSEFPDDARKICADLRRALKIGFHQQGRGLCRAKICHAAPGVPRHETHKDYEVIRHGDNGAAFKLKHPPVESCPRN